MNPFRRCYEARGATSAQSSRLGITTLYDDPVAMPRYPAPHWSRAPPAIGAAGDRQHHIKVNWNQQAVKAAKGYMQEGGFSYSGA